MKRATKILSIALLVCLSIYTTVYLNLNRGSKVVNGIEISEVLLVHTRDRGIDYCEILSTATKGDEESIRELLLLEIYDAAGYDHGIVIVDLIKIVGEDKIIRAIEVMNCKQKTSITSYIEAGLQYGNNPNSAKQELNDIFPDVYNSLKC